MQRREYLLKRPHSALNVSWIHCGEGELTECEIFLNIVLIIVIKIYSVVKQIICKFLKVKHLYIELLSAYVIVLMLQTIVILLRCWPSCGPLRSPC